MNGTISYELNNFILYLVVNVKLKLDSLRGFSSLFLTPQWAGGIRMCSFLREQQTGGTVLYCSSLRDEFRALLSTAADLCTLIEL